MWIILGVCAAVFVLVIAFAGAQGAFDGGMNDEEADVPPAQRLTDDAGAADIAAVRFTPTLWGYRPAEVDDALARLQARIAVQDARLAALGERTPEADAATSDGTRTRADARDGRRAATDLSVDAARDRDRDSATFRDTDASASPGTGTSSGRFLTDGSGAATFLNDL